MVPIQELVLTRNKERPKSKLLPQNRENNDSNSSFKASTTNVVQASGCEGTSFSVFYLCKEQNFDNLLFFSIINIIVTLP